MILMSRPPRRGTGSDSARSRKRRREVGTGVRGKETPTHAGRRANDGPSRPHSRVGMESYAPEGAAHVVQDQEAEASDPIRAERMPAGHSSRFTGNPPVSNPTRATSTLTRTGTARTAPGHAGAPGRIWAAAPWDTCDRGHQRSDQRSREHPARPHRASVARSSRRGLDGPPRRHRGAPSSLEPRSTFEPVIAGGAGGFRS